MVTAPETKTSKIAVIGAGRWGRNIIRTLDTHTGVCVIAHGENTEAMVYLEEHFPHIPHTADYQTVLQDTTVTSVCIATPIATHADIVREALIAGKHVFVEKPLSLETTVIAELYTLADTRNLTLFTGYMYTYDPTFSVLKKELESADSYTIETTWTKYGTFDSPLPENLLVHELALCHGLLGSLDLKNIIRNEENVFEGDFVGNRGNAHVYIDREQQEKKKVLTVRTESSLYTMTIGTLTVQDLITKEEKVLYENTETQLLDIELKNFLAETKEGASTNSKRRSMDISIAAVLGHLTSV